jgi:hypothetical protein
VCVACAVLLVLPHIAAVWAPLVAWAGGADALTGASRLVVVFPLQPSSAASPQNISMIAGGLYALAKAYLVFSNSGRVPVQFVTGWLALDLLAVVVSFLTGAGAFDNWLSHAILYPIGKALAVPPPSIMLYSAIWHFAMHVSARILFLTVVKNYGDAAAPAPHAD